MADNDAGRDALRCRKTLHFLRTAGEVGNKTMQVGLRNEEGGGSSVGFFLQRRIGIAIPVTVEENRFVAVKEDMGRFMEKVNQK